MAQVFGFTRNDIEKVLKASMKDYAREVADLLKQPTEAWRSDFRPQFIVTEPRMEGNDLVVYAGVKKGRGTNEEDVDPADVYLWISRGTKVHRIAARRVPRLAFMSEYRPSTKQGSWDSSTPSYGGWLRKPAAVTHFGITPRNFEEKAAEEKGPGFGPFLQQRLGLTVRARMIPFGSALQEAESISAKRGVLRPWRA